MDRNIFASSGDGAVRLWQLEKEEDQIVLQLLHFKVLNQTSTISIFLPGNAVSEVIDPKAEKNTLAVYTPGLPNSTCLLSAYKDGSLRLLDIHRMLVLHKSVMEASISHLALIIDPKGIPLILVGLTDGRVVLLNRKTLVTLHTILKHKGIKINCIQVSKANPSLWFILDCDGNFSIWSLIDSTKHAEKCFTMLQYTHLTDRSSFQNKTSSQYYAVFSNPKSVYFTQPNSSDISIYSFTLNKISSFLTINQSATCLAASNDGQYLAVGTLSREVLLIHLSDKSVQTLLSSVEEIVSVDFNEISSKLIIVSTGDISIINLE